MSIVTVLTFSGHLIIGHGSGSFGHYMASKYGTRRGVNGPEQWMGFAKGETVPIVGNGHNSPTYLIN